jgi:hypothetical protein
MQHKYIQLARVISELLISTGSTEYKLYTIACLLLAANHGLSLLSCYTHGVFLGFQYCCLVIYVDCRRRHRDISFGYYFQNVMAEEAPQLSVLYLDKQRNQDNMPKRGML